MRTAIGWATPDASPAKPVSTAEYAPVSSGTWCGKSRFTMAGMITLQTATAAPRMAVPTHRLPDQPGRDRSTVPKIKHQQRIEHRTFGADPPGQQVDQRRHGGKRQQRHRSEQTEATGVQAGVAADELEDRPDGRDRRAQVGGDDEHGDRRQHDRRARSDRCGGIGEGLGVRGDSFRPVTKAHSAISREAILRTWPTVTLLLEHSSSTQRPRSQCSSEFLISGLILAPRMCYIKPMAVNIDLH